MSTLLEILDHISWLILLLNRPVTETYHLYILDGKFVLEPKETKNLEAKLVAHLSADQINNGLSVREWGLISTSLKLLKGMGKL